MDSKNDSYARTSDGESMFEGRTTDTGTNFAEVTRGRPLAATSSTPNAAESAHPHFAKSKRVAQVKDAPDSSAGAKAGAPAPRGINPAFGGFKKSSKKRGGA